MSARHHHSPASLIIYLFRLHAHLAASSTLPWLVRGVAEHATWILAIAVKLVWPAQLLNQFDIVREGVCDVTKQARCAGVSFTLQC